LDSVGRHLEHICRSPNVPLGFALACGIVAIIRRQRAIGGWLFYFFCQVLLGMAMVTASTHWKNYSPGGWSSPRRYFLFTLFNLSRVLLLAVSPSTAFSGSKHVNGSGSSSCNTPSVLTPSSHPQIAGRRVLLSVGDQTRRDVAVFPVVWLGYFAVSRRVRKVFLERSWGRV